MSMRILGSNSEGGVSQNCVLNQIITRLKVLVAFTALTFGPNVDSGPKMHTFQVPAVQRSYVCGMIG